MKRSMILSMAVLVVCCGFVSADITNMVLNPGFEDEVDFADWFHAAGALEISDNGPSAPGLQAAEVPVGNDIRIRTIAVTPGQTVDVSWDYKVEGDGWFWGMLRFYADENATTWLGQDAFAHDPTDWTTRSFTSSAIPAGANFVDVAFFNGTATTGSITVDNISVVPEPMTMSLLGLGGLLLRRRKK